MGPSADQPLNCVDDGFYLGEKYRDPIVSELEFYGEPQYGEFLTCLRFAGIIIFIMMKNLLMVLSICLGIVLGTNALSAVNKDSEFSFSTFYNPATNNFISDLPEMLKILKNHGFRQIGVETGPWETLCQMMGYDCVKVYTYKKNDITVKLYIDDIIDPHGEWISTDIIFRSEAEKAKFIKDATDIGFVEGVPVEGSVYYTRELCAFESGGRYIAEFDEIYPAIQLGVGDDDPDRDAQIFKLTPEVEAKLNKYDEIDLFSYGLARVCKNGKWGFIDLNGDEVIPCIYDMGVGRFSEGLALVELYYDFEYGATKVMFIDNKGREIISGNYYYLPPIGSSLDLSFVEPPVFSNGKCLVWVDAKLAFPNDNFEDNEMVPVMINKKGEILLTDYDDFTDDDDDLLDKDYLSGEYEINRYPYGYWTPIDKAYEHEDLTGSPYYIGRDTISGGNGTSLVYLYLVDLTQPKISQMVQEIHGIMDYNGASTISPISKTNFEKSAFEYISQCWRHEKKGAPTR